MSPLLHRFPRYRSRRAVRTTAARLRLTLIAVASTLVFCSASTTLAAPIVSEVVSCSGGALGTCTIEPTGGPVAVDPTGFTLEVMWGPDYIFVTEDPGGGTQSH